MKKIIICLLLFALGLYGSAVQAQILSAGAGTEFSIGAGTIVSADSLELAPAATFSFSNNTLSKSNTVSNTTSINYINKVYQFSATTNSYSGALKMYYNNDQLNGLSASDLKLLINNGTSWSLDNSSSSNTASKVVFNNSVSGVSLKEITAATCSPNTGDTSAFACGSFEWYGITYTASGTPTHTFTNVGGCDSVVTLHLTINAIPSTPIVNVVNNYDGTFTLSTFTSGSLLWSTTETTSSITVSNAGIYTVTQTVIGCTSDAGTGIAASVTLTSNTTQICGGSTVTFTATENFDPNYLNWYPMQTQWEVSHDGGASFTNLPGQYQSTFTTSSLLNNDIVRVKSLYDDFSNNSQIEIVSNQIQVQVNSTMADINTISTATSGSIKFNGSNQYLTLSNAPNYHTDAFTIDGWFRLDAAPASDIVPIIGAEGADNLSVLIQSNLNTIVIDAYQDHGDFFTVPTITVGAWHHLVVVRNSSSDFTVFLDGQRSSSGAITESHAFTSTANANVGLFQGKYFNGFLSNLRIVTGSSLYDPTQTTITVPTSLTTAVTNTNLLLNAVNASSLLSDGSGTQSSITNNGDATWSSGAPFLVNLTSSSNATISNATVGGVWSSSNNSILQVNSSGVLTPIATGNATITYTVTSNTPFTCVSSEPSLFSVIMSITGDTTATACGSFEWYGVTYTASATPTHTFTNVNGNDSIVTLHLTITAQPTQPSLACYQTANFNTTSCSWDVTGSQPTQPSIACYESANFNTTSCSWNVTGSQPSLPTLTCYETATFNTTTCSWNVTGTQPTQPTLACYETATFNSTTCSWDVTGTQPTQPTSVFANPIAGNLKVCGLYAGATTLTTTPIEGSSTYNWTVPSDMNITSGQGTTTITVFWDNIYLLQNGIVGNVTVTPVLSTAGCTTVVPASIPVDLQYTAPVTPPSISGPNTICPNESGVYSIALVNRASAYEWTLPTGASITSGLGSNIINVSYGNGFTGGNISVRSKNVCGLSASLRNRNVTLNVLPAPASITGPANGLCSATNSNYLVTPVVGASGYNWTVPATGSINSGSNINNISVNYNALFRTGNITVAAINNCGAGASRSLAVRAVPATPGTITGPASACAGSTQTYGIQTVQGASNYIWTVPGGAVINSGQGTKNLSLNFGSNASANGTITVKSSNTCGTSVAKVLAVVTTVCPRLGEAVIQLQVYPNPANDYINVSFNVEETQQATIILRDAAGRVVYNEAIYAAAGFNNQQIELSSLSKGVYFVQLQTASSSENTRLIIK